jgi:Xaa-Pro dipeptidase
MLQDADLKFARIRKLLNEKGAEALVLTSQTSFSWLTGGRGFIGIASEGACAKIVVGREHVVLVANNIEAERLGQEEVQGEDFQIKGFDWYDASGEQKILESIARPDQVLYEGDVLSELLHLRQPLTENEQEKYRKLGQDVGSAIEKTCYNVKPEMTEFEVAAELASACIELEVEPITNLIAADKRIYLRRHPLPTNNKIDRYVMLVIGGRRNGLIVSASRLVHFGEIPEELLRKHEAVTNVDASLLKETRPGRKAADLFQMIGSKYEEFDYKDEWKYHHQGGMTGYAPREYRATPDSKEVVGVHQAFAWNPSIAGVKSEDTILVGENKNEILSRTGEYPEVKVDVEGTIIPRPAILKRNLYL